MLPQDARNPIMSGNETHTLFFIVIPVCHAQNSTEDLSGCFTTRLILQHFKRKVSWNVSCMTKSGTTEP